MNKNNYVLIPRSEYEALLKIAQKARDLNRLFTELGVRIYPITPLEIEVRMSEAIYEFRKALGEVSS